MKTIFIGLGSNLGNRQANCEQAIQRLKNHPQIKVLKISKWMESHALCLTGETGPDFINGAVEIKTDLSPQNLFAELKKIEAALGRESASKKWQPRVIDLDILFYGDQIIETPNLKIPHPLLHERLFVLEPLAAIAPDFVHPILKKTIREFLQNFPLLNQSGRAKNRPKKGACHGK